MLAEAHLHSPGNFSDGRLGEDGVSALTWLFTLCSAVLVGSTGVFPLLFIPQNSAFKNGFEPNRLKVLLSFAVGGLLGDVFLHLLPEAHNQAKGHDHSTVGLLVIAGLVSFLAAEKLMSLTQEDGEESEAHPLVTDTDTAHRADSQQDTSSGELRRRPLRSPTHSNGNVAGTIADQGSKDVGTEHSQKKEKISPAGYLNLLANIVDNFTHGLAVAASYLAGHKVGLLTTFAIIIHEVPHEIGDFAILLNSGFDRSGAARAQLSTASGAVVGAVAGLLLQGVGDCAFWVLPFTAGGFLYIALVSVLPSLLSESEPKQTFWQFVALFGGLLLMKIFSGLE